MNWPKLVYRMAEYFDRSPLIKAFLVLQFILDVIGAVILSILFLAKAFI